MVLWNECCGSDRRQTGFLRSEDTLLRGVPYGIGWRESGGLDAAFALEGIICRVFS
jgi:hypothetical protein